MTIDNAPAQVSDTPIESVQPKQQVTLDSLAEGLNALGEQMNWLCENMQALFSFVNQIGASGGGIRGLLQAAKSAPQLKENGTDD